MCKVRPKPPYTRERSHRRDSRPMNTFMNDHEARAAASQGATLAPAPARPGGRAS